MIELDRIIMKYKHDILFIKPYGNIMKTDINDFNYKVIPIIVKLDIKDVVLNMENVKKIDKALIDVLSSLNYLIRKNSGRFVICSLNKIYEKLFSRLSDEFVFNAIDEISSMEVLKI